VKVHDTLYYNERKIMSIDSMFENNELLPLDERKLEEIEICPHCKEKHLVVSNDSDDPIIDKMFNYVLCPKDDKFYLVGLDGKTRR
jgi:uncharacterized protein YbaR (Trm112 family)